MKPRWGLVAAALVSLAIGCSYTVKTQPGSVNAPNASIRAAQELGAADHPRAAYHLQLAEEELKRSRAYASAGDAKLATRLAERSSADAELAITIVRSEEAKGEAAAVVEQLRVLHNPPR
jgi:hypothetical protein